LKTPQYFSSFEDTKQISIIWNIPENNGGCPVLGYELYRDDGQGGEVTTKIEEMASDNPSLTSYTIDLSADGVVGQIYRFKIVGTNYAGQIDSSALYVALASLPSKPTTIPTSDPTITN